MKKTTNLGLPIYDNPIEDKFKLIEWNEANESIDKAYKEIIDIKAEISTVNANAELVEARKGQPTLRKKIDVMDIEISTLVDFLNYMPINGGTFDEFDGNESIDVLIDGGVY